MDVQRDSGDIKAEEIRLIGNKYLCQGNELEALFNYEYSIHRAHSPQTKALAYANRSYVYFRMKEYRSCLESIKYALDNNYPGDKLHIIIERKQECLKKLAAAENNELEPWYDYKEFYQKNIFPKSASEI